MWHSRATTSGGEYSITTDDDDEAETCLDRV
jgi:hypothetical protein